MYSETLVCKASLDVNSYIHRFILEAKLCKSFKIFYKLIVCTFSIWKTLEVPIFFFFVRESISEILMKQIKGIKDLCNKTASHAKYYCSTGISFRRSKIWAMNVREGNKNKQIRLTKLCLLCSRSAKKKTFTPGSLCDVTIGMK